MQLLGKLRGVGDYSFYSHRAQCVLVLIVAYVTLRNDIQDL